MSLDFRETANVSRFSVVSPKTTTMSDLGTCSKIAHEVSGKQVNATKFLTNKHNKYGKRLVAVSSTTKPFDVQLSLQLVCLAFLLKSVPRFFCKAQKNPYKLSGTREFPGRQVNTSSCSLALVARS